MAITSSSRPLVFRVFRMIALCTLAFTILMSTLPATAAAESKGKVTATSLYVRKQPNADADAICSIRTGTVVTILSEEDGWYRVKTGAHKGYVAKQYISTSTESSSSSESSKSDLGTIASLGSAPNTSKPGDKSNHVLKLQKALTIAGYYSGNLTGNYGNLTKEAVQAFQKKKGLSADGIAGKVTIKTLFGENAGNANSSSSSEKSTSKSYKTERLNWFKGGNGKIPNGSKIIVKDVQTGSTFEAKRRYGSNHLDAEPLTKSDTKTLKAIYGGSWSWRRRAILVKYDGHVYAASMNGMPHAAEDENIADNNFDGVFCIHFYGSKTHGSDKVDSEHSNCIAKAMKATW